MGCIALGALQRADAASQEHEACLCSCHGKVQRPCTWACLASLVRRARLSRTHVGRTNAPRHTRFPAPPPRLHRSLCLSSPFLLCVAQAHPHLGLLPPASPREGGNNNKDGTVTSPRLAAAAVRAAGSAFMARLKSSMPSVRRSSVSGLHYHSGAAPVVCFRWRQGAGPGRA